MSDWIHALSVGWMTVIIFAATFVVAAGILALVLALATGDRARAFKGVSAGLLPPLGIIFGLLVAFVAAQVWGDVDRATAAVNREASALRGVVLLAKAFPGEPETRLRGFVSQYIREARDVEWPAMAVRRATLTMVPAPLASSLEAAVMLPATGPGQVAAQREIISALENAFDARRQRILVSRSEVNWVKWTALIIQALITLVAIAMVHSDHRSSAVLAIGLFATAMAVCVVLIAMHDRPFTGQLAVRPDALLQVQP
jgi:amino acid transporter